MMSESGAVEQVVHYYPYGMAFADGTNVDAQRFKYNGKELDAEDGLNWMDYGARMYDAALGRWGGVDALAEKNNNQSPYSYCVGNPIRYIDPCGLDTFNISDNKRIERMEGGENDVFMFEDKQVASIKGNSTTLRHVTVSNKPNGLGYDILQIANREDAEKVFKGIADESGNEWSLIETGEYGKGYVSTSYNESEERAGGYLYENANKFNISKVWRHIHSHPFISYSSSSFPSGSDVDFVKHYMNIPSFAKTKYYVYRPLYFDFLQYHHNTNIYSYTDKNTLKLWIK